MRALILLIAISLFGCAETVGCPPDQYFGPTGACIPIPDGGPDGGRDASTTDGG